jgi:hypothetical protein
MDIKRVLKKNFGKGEKLGKLLIHTLVDDFLSTSDSQHKPAVTMQDINTMKDSIKSSHEGKIYNEYHALYNMLLELFNMNDTQAQQIYHGFFRLATYIEGALAANSIREAITEEIPLIMTEQQYNKKKAELRAINVSYAELIYEVVSYYRGFDDNLKGLSAKIKKTIARLQKKHVTNKRVLAIYNEVMYIGFNELPDGRRQDQMSKEEWEKLLDEEYDKGHIIVDKNGTPLSQKFVKDKEAMKNFLTEIMRIEFLGEYIGEPEEKIQEKIYKSMNLIPLKHRISTEYPKNLTLLDILDNIDLFYGLVDNDTKSIAEFFVDFQELYEAIRDELCNIKPLKEKISKLNPKQYYSGKFATWGQLADWRVLDFPVKIQPDAWSLKGIAVLKQSNKWDVDEHDNYTDPYMKIKHHLFDLENLAEQEEDIIFAKNLFLSSCKNYTACLALMRILGEIYDVIEDVEILTSKTHGLVDNKANDVNRLAAHLHHSVKEDVKKQTLVKKLFPPIDVVNLLPTKDAIEMMKKRLVNNRGDLKYMYPATLRAEFIKTSIKEHKNVQNTD